MRDGESLFNSDGAYDWLRSSGVPPLSGVIGDSVRAEERRDRGVIVFDRSTFPPAWFESGDPVILAELPAFWCARRPPFLLCLDFCVVAFGGTFHVTLEGVLGRDPLS